MLISGQSGPSEPHIDASIFYKKTTTNLGTFGTIWTSYMALYIFKKLVCISGPLGPHIYISLDLIKKLKQFLGPARPYIYDYLFFKNTCLNIGTLRTSYMSLYILLKN